MTVNKQNIDRLIEIIWNEQGERETDFRMSWWIASEDPEASDFEIFARKQWVAPTPQTFKPCGTAACLSGHIALERIQQSSGKTAFQWVASDTDTFDALNVVRNEAHNIIDNGKWLGLDIMQSGCLFTMENSDGVQICDREEFDRLPAKCRALYAIKVLRLLRDTGRVDWEAVLPKSLIMDAYRRLF